MSKENRTKPESILDEPDSNPFIQGDNKVKEEQQKQDSEIVESLIELAKKGAVRIKIIHNSAQNNWRGEIAWKDSGNIVYFTDIPIDFMHLERRILQSGIMPEYIEE